MCTQMCILEESVPKNEHIHENLMLAKYVYGKLLAEMQFLGKYALKCQQLVVITHTHTHAN